MATSNLKYSLKNGFIHNWLVAGPEIIPVTKLSGYPRDKLETSILTQYYSADSGVTEIPVDLGPLAKQGDQVSPFSWHYYFCNDDHFIDLTSFYPACHYLRAWAYAQVVFPAAQNINLILNSNGPADLWLNWKHVHRQKHYSKQKPVSAAFQVAVAPGANEFLFRFEIAAVRETPFVMALKFDGELSGDISVVIPTNIEAERLETRMQYEEIIERGYLEKYVYGWLTGDQYDKNEPITVRFTQDLNLNAPIDLAYRLQSLNQDIFQEGNKPSDASTVYELAKKYPLRNGPHHLELVPEVGMYYIKKIQLQRRDIFYVVRTAYSDHLYSIIHERRREAIEDAAQRRGDSLYTEIAKMVMGLWEKVDKEILQKAFDRINQRQDSCITDLIGLIGVWLHFKRRPEFPKGLKSSIETCLAGFRYWEDEPGDDVMDFKTESRQLLFHACEILAGQILLDRNFTNSNQNGRWHIEKGERLATAWLTDHGAYGWQDWDSSNGFEEELTALSYLIDYANSYNVSELASIMMDKILFNIAINSSKGAFGSTHGRSDTASLLSSRLEATSGITRIMWGMGNFNEHVMGTVSLALMKKYDLSNVLKNIAIRRAEGFWDRERHGSKHEPDRNDQPREVNKVTYKTDEFMLCSAQDYGAFSPGSHEHIWQATLGPDAVVFVNHPACISESDAHQPNFWNGNASRPRVVQWGDILVAQYRLPADDWLGFTHAYFPTTAFDEYKLDDHWAFARKGKGYLALYSKQGFELITHGQSAYRELRSFGKENLWVCHMGQELLDGSFENFQQKTQSLALDIEGLTIHLHNLRGDEITFDLEGHLIVNGQEQAISGYRHYENPYCIADYPAEKMEIGIDDQGMRLNFTEE